MQLSSNEEASCPIDIRDDAELFDAFRASGLEPCPILGEEFGGDDISVPVLILLSGTEHRERRRAVAPAFGQAQVYKWEAHFQRMLEDQLSAISLDRRTIEIADEVLWPFVSRATCDFVGLPDQDQWLSEVGRSTVDPDLTNRRRTLAAVRLHRGIREVAKGIPTYDPPPESLLAYLKGVEASTADAVGALMMLLAGGTTLTIRGVLACLLAGSSNEIMEDRYIVDQLLAKEPVIDAVLRKVSSRTIIGTRELDPGSFVRLWLKGNSAYVFGRGAHYCLGAAWIRSICTVTVKILKKYDLEIVTVDRNNDRPPIPGGIRELSVRLFRSPNAEHQGERVHS